MMTRLASLDMSVPDQYMPKQQPDYKEFYLENILFTNASHDVRRHTFIFFALHRKHDVCGRFRVMMPVFVRFLGGSSEVPRDPAVAETLGCGVCPSRLSRY